MLVTDVSARDFFSLAVMGSDVGAGWTRQPELLGKGCCKSCVH